ncbi:MAG: hypothetical protein ACRYFS_08065 [Janthinobacterium lividum]
MPVHIKHLRCRVTVKSKGHDAPVTHHPSGPSQPSLKFALAAPAPRAEASQPEPIQAVQTAAGKPGEAKTTEAASEAKKADPRVVADRVYDLMKQEITLARQRGGSGRRG